MYFFDDAARSYVVACLLDGDSYALHGLAIVHDVNIQSNEIFANILSCTL